MYTDNLYDRYFDIAMKIHSICFDLGLSSDDARLYVYMYVKASESPDGIECFEKDCNVEIDTLKSMLQRGIENAVVFNGKVSPELLLSIFKAFVNKSLSSVERELQTEFGFENTLNCELANRLRFHSDESYRKNHMNIFTNVILYEICRYDDEKIKLSSINYQIKLAHEEKELNLLINS